jgi:hypothetical protein
MFKLFISINLEESLVAIKDIVITHIYLYSVRDTKGIVTWKYEARQSPFFVAA